MLHSGIYGEHYLIFNPSRNIHFQTQKGSPVRPVQQFNSPFKRCLSFIPLPHLLARVTAARRTNNFRKKTVSTYMRILYRIVGSSLCATWKRMLKVFKCELLFIFAADTHTHTYTQRVMLRAHFCCLLLCAAKIVRHLEHVWVARVCAAVCVCVRASVYESQL